MELKIGMVVKSVAGHDAGSFYVIVKATKDRVYIADGKLRKLEKPKRKNPVHLKKSCEVIDLLKFKTNKSLREFLREHYLK